MEKPTPGPWTVADKTPADFYHGPDAIICPSGDKRRVLCEMNTNFPYEADARLIAASPELYTSLKDLVAYIDRGNWADHNLDNILRAARAAITKAVTE